MNRRHVLLIAVYVAVVVVAVVLSYQQGQNSQGVQGERGERGDVGEQGAPGVSGTICPEGFGQQQIRVVTVAGVREVLVCARD